MRLERLHLRHFRNFTDAELALGPRFTVLHGHNGAGKTSVLEALYFLSTLRSFRGADLGTLLQRGSSKASVDLRAFDEDLGLPTRLHVRIERGERSTRRTAQLDGKTIRSAADFYGRVRAVLFTPEDLQVLRGSPGGRRRFLDRVLFARERAHIGDIQRYEKLVRSRNQVLKDRGPREMLDTYEEGIAEVGARVWARRLAVLDDLSPPFVEAFGAIFGSDVEVGLGYACRVDPEGAVAPEHMRQAMLEALQRARPKDELRGTTSVGPHLDDLIVRIGGEVAGDFASQGQARAIVLAFKIAEMRHARTSTGHAPLMLLDDVSSELDPARNAQLFSTLSSEGGQCVMTTTSPEFIRLDPGAERLDIEVRQGAIVAPSGTA